MKKIYIDTMVIDKWSRRDGQLAERFDHLLERAAKGDCICVTSSLAVMEMFDLEQERQFFRVEVNKRNSDIQSIYSGRNQRKLTPQSLALARNNVIKRVDSSPYIQVIHPKAEDMARLGQTIASYTNIFTMDCLHLAIALLEGADLMLTEDTHFRTCINAQLQSRGQPGIAVRNVLAELTGVSELRIRAVSHNEVIGAL